MTELRQRQVSDAAAKLSTDGRQVEGVVLRGWPATMLIDQAARFEADLVMAGSRGYGAVASMLLGSVSAAVVDTAPCPVMVARTSQVHEIVLAVDGSGPSEVAESLLSTWPIFEGPKLHVVSVAEVMEPVQFGLAPPKYHRAAAEHASAVAEEKENQPGSPTRPPPDSELPVDRRTPRCARVVRRTRSSRWHRKLAPTSWSWDLRAGQGFPGWSWGAWREKCSTALQGQY